MKRPGIRSSAAPESGYDAPMLPPGPRTPVLWQTFRIMAQPKSYANHLRARYGDAMSFHTLAGRGLAVLEAALAREVFAASPDAFEPLSSIGGLFGERAVIATSGAEHKKQRKLLNPPFHGPRIKALFDTMRRVVRAHLAKLSPLAGTDTVVRMTEVTQAMTLDVILETVFGSNVQGPDLDRGRKVLLALTHAFHPSLITTTKLQSKYFGPWRSYHRARQDFDVWVGSLVEDRRKRGQWGDDLLALFLTTRYDDGEAMSDVEIRDHLVTLLLAGHETSAIAIAWATYWLIREPDVLARLRAEVATLGNNPSVERLVRLPYLNAVASETLRIEPIVTDVIRKCRVPFTLRSFTVPAGDLVAVMLGAILNDGRIYPDPDRFQPDRFLDRTFHAGEFLPFGGGQRRCLGAAFAEAELAIAIAEIAIGLELELVDTAPERAVRRNITMGPKGGVRVRVKRVDIDADPVLAAAS